MSATEVGVYAVAVVFAILALFCWYRSASTASREDWASEQDCGLSRW